MQTMLTAFTTMVMMLLYAAPGFIFIKTKLIGQDGILPFSKLLLFVCQPMLIIYTMTQVRYTPSLLGEMAIVFVFMLVLQFGMIALFAFVVPLATSFSFSSSRTFS